MRPAQVLVASFALAGCAAHPISFEGRARDRVVEAEAVVETALLPRDAVRIGRLSVRCTPLDEWKAFEDVSLVDLDCTEARARRMLREAAAEHGGDVLAGVDCDDGASLGCDAVLGLRPSAARTPLAPRDARDVRGTHGAAVRLEFVPELARSPGPARPEERVRELATLPPSHLRVGSVAVRCDDCHELAARDAVRIAVGRLGGTDAVGVHCESWGRGQRCTGSAAIAEREPDPVID